MGNVWYLVVVVLLSALGVMVIWLRSRPSSSPKSSIDQFNDKMKALSPEMAIRTDRTSTPPGASQATAKRAADSVDHGHGVRGDQRRRDSDPTELS